MNPIKFKEVVNETARRLHQPPELVATVLQCYFKNLRTALTSLSHPRIQVLNLGTFELKPATIEKKLCSKKQRLQQLSQPLTRHQHLKKDLQQQVTAIEQALTQIETEKQRKQQCKQKRQLHE